MATCPVTNLQLSAALHRHIILPVEQGIESHFALTITFLCILYGTNDTYIILNLVHVCHIVIQRPELLKNVVMNYHFTCRYSKPQVHWI